MLVVLWRSQLMMRSAPVSMLPHMSLGFKTDAVAVVKSALWQQRGSTTDQGYQYCLVVGGSSAYGMVKAKH